jgi:hypothetical protein
MTGGQEVRLAAWKDFHDHSYGAEEVPFDLVNSRLQPVRIMWHDGPSFHVKQLTDAVYTGLITLVFR